MRGVEIPPNFFTLNRIYPCSHYFSFFIFRFGRSLTVFNAVKQGTLLVDNWLMCESCEIISPIFNNECLVCSEVIDLTSGEDFTEIDLMV